MEVNMRDVDKAVIDAAVEYAQTKKGWNQLVEAVVAYRRAGDAVDPAEMVVREMLEWAKADSTFSYRTMMGIMSKHGMGAE
jgi:hypothetical protein